MKPITKITTAANSSTMNAVTKQSLFAGAEEPGTTPGFNVENEVSQSIPKKGIKKLKHILKKNTRK